MSSINKAKREELEFIEGMCSAMGAFARMRSRFYPAQTIEITTSLGDRHITYRVELGETRPK